jgi:O-antigen/teichoic acid export membrane protein
MPSSAGQLSENSRRLARNTLLLYFRMFLLLLIGLFTSRVVLRTLGVDDYGVYQVVGGVVTVFTFLTNSISAAISRYLAVGLGKGDPAHLRRIFSTGVLIQLGLSLLLVLLTETAGLWWLNHRLIIPDGRLEAARWVLHCSLGVLVVTLLAVPYNAAIIAHERMSAFALISLGEALLKLGVALLLFFSPFDKLVSYAVLMLAVAVLVRIAYGLYCRHFFAETRGRLVYDGALTREMTAFAGWSFFGSSGYVLNTQGAGQVVNLFFGVAVNAARGVALQIENTVKQFVSNFLTALNPQITKAWAAGERDYCFELVRKGAKYAWLVILACFIPIFGEAEWLLDLWLGPDKVPPYAPVFVRLALVGLLVDLAGNSLHTLVQATGNVRRFYLVTGLTSYLGLPLTWLCFKLGAGPSLAYVVFVAVYLAVFIERMVLVHRLTDFPLLPYLRLLALLMMTSAFSLVFPLLARAFGWAPGWRLLFGALLGWATQAHFTWHYLLTPGEKSWILQKLRLNRVPEPPSGLDPETPGTKIAVYTCIVGAYDALQQPPVLDEGFDFICFVGQGERTAERIGAWEIRELPQRLGAATLDARWAKTHPHELLPDYACSVWIDGNIALLDASLYEAVRRKAASDVQYSGVPHPTRDCTYDEARKCLDMRYLTVFDWLKVLCFLGLQGLPRHAGLMESNLVFRRHLDPAVVAFDARWWDRILHLSRRDQLSLMECLRHSNIRWDDRLLDGLNTRNHPGFKYLLHK